MCLGKEPGFGRVLIRVSSSGGRNGGLESRTRQDPHPFANAAQEESVVVGGEISCASYARRSDLGVTYVAF